MSAITTYPTLTISQTTEAIAAIGQHNTVLVLSEPGCGKTSILRGLAEMFGDKWRKVGDYFEDDKYDYVYIDGPNKEMMDLAAAIPNHTTKSMEYYVSSLFNLDNPRPKVVLIDEALKVPKLLQPIYTRMYLEKTVGDRPLTPGSYVLATSNNSSDGVGDVLPAHTANRLTIVKMQKPSMQEWLIWAQDRDIHPIVKATVAVYPRMLKSYLDPDQQDNPYIFHPSKPSMSFVSPRSLEKCDAIIRAKLPEAVTLGLLCGTIGERGGRDMSAFVQMESKVEKFDNIIKDPMGIKMPDENDTAPLLLMIFQALDHIDSQDKLNKFQMFVNRIKQVEIQTLWFVILLRSKLARLARYNETVTKWSIANHHLLG
jgi:hypothetical protein